MVKPALGAFLAAVAMFMWGFFYWGSGLIDPFSHMTAENETAISEALKTNLPADGVYFVPESKHDTPENWQARMNAGPVAMINFKSGGTPPMSQTMLAGFLHMLGTAILLALLLTLLLPVASTYLDRLKIVALVGAIAAFEAHMGQPIWWHWPWAHALIGAGYTFGSYLIAGLVLSYFVTPAKA
jgi:hypothetical protein